MMCTTCLAAKLRTGAIESTIATGPSTGISSLDADLLEQLAVQRVDEALARVHAAAGQQPVLLAVLLVPAEQDAVACQRRIAETRIRGSAHHACRGAEAADAALALGQLVDLDRARASGTGSDDELGDPHAGLDHERLARVGVEQDHPELAAVAGVDRARACSRP